MGSLVELKDRQSPSVLQETTDLALFVRTSSDNRSGWDRQKIVEAMVREADVPHSEAERISLEVEEIIIKAGIKFVTAPLIRELVDAKLIECGLEDARKKHTRLGVPLYDVDQMILHPNKENANVPHGPEATNLTLAEGIKRAVRIPVIGVGNIREAEYADRAVREEKIDLVAVGRELLKDPSWAEKAARRLKGE